MARIIFSVIGRRAPRFFQGVLPCPWIVPEWDVVDTQAGETRRALQGASIGDSG